MLWVIVVYKGENMQWSADNTPTAIQGKSLKLRELFAKVANASLAKGFSKEESIFAGTNAVKIEERKNQPAKVKAPKLPSHVESLRSYTNPFEMVSKAENELPIAATVKAAEFDAQGHLVILMSDGRRVVTKGKAVEQHIDQRIVIAAENKASSTFSVMKEPTGFETRNTSTINFNSINRTFTIAATNAQEGFNVWLHSNLHTYFSESVQIPNESKIHFIYFDGNSETLMSTSNVSEDLFLEHALVALIYWRADQQKVIYFGDERHGLRMDGATHSHLHLSIGAQYRSGLGLNNFQVDQNASLNSHAQFGCENGVIADEDITITITDDLPQNISTVGHFPVFYRIGTQDNWYRKEATVFPLILPTEVPHYSGTTRLAYNHYNGSNWVLSEVPNNEFVLVHVLATNDINNPIVTVLGKSYNTKTNARKASQLELKEMQGLPFLEFVKLGTVIYQTANSYNNTPKAKVVSTDDAENYVDHRTSLHSIVIF
jgi:hypothetical protein